MGLRVQEEGASECRSVMGRIGVASWWQDHPAAKAGRLPSGVGVREPWANRLEEAMQISRRSATLQLVRLPTVPCVGPPAVTYRLPASPRPSTACRRGAEA